MCATPAARLSTCAVGVVSDYSNPDGRVAAVRAVAAGSAAVSYPIGIRRLGVLRTQRIGSAIVRVTLGGPGLEVDLVLHDGGLAAGWATTVAVGEEIDVAGPRG